MSGYVLDSDHLSLYQQGHESLRSYLVAIPPEQIAITIISVEELVRGRLAQVSKANTPKARVMAYYWLAETFDFLQNFKVLGYDESAEQYFEQFRQQKIRVGTQDLRIAAITLSQQAVLVTRNRRDFERVPQLNFTDWTIPSQK
jgi:tRNA(fMet)-specific endonuclease VapC